MKRILSTFLLLVPLILTAQRYISGRVTDNSDGLPVPGASVFISNTTIGVATDTAGYYRLRIPGQGSYQLAVSHAGYKPFFSDIEPGKTLIKRDFTLYFRDLKEVTVASTVKTRKEDVNLFWKTILGKKPSKKTIDVKNPEEVFFYYNSNTKILNVTCRVPLQIANNETGYMIYYLLDRFMHDYNTKITSWDARYLFSELKPENTRQKKTWDKNRQKVHQVSVNSFIRALYNDSLMGNGFLLTYPGDLTDKTQKELKLADRNNFLFTDSINGLKSIYFPKDSSVMLVCFGYGKPVDHKDLLNVEFAQNSRIKWSLTGLFRNTIYTPGDTVQIFPDGTFINPLQLSPRFLSNSLTGLNMTLPIDFDPDNNSGLVVNVIDDLSEKEQIVEESTKKVNPENPVLDSLNKVIKRFDMQLNVFPQEKIYLHTDKPYYFSGERIWFRAHVVNAATHVPDFSANIVYAELYNAMDLIVSRIKAGFDNDVYSGYINIPENLPEGDYTIRAYTNLMRYYDEDYFFIKTIRIVNSMTPIISAIPNFDFSTNNKTINTDFKFSNILTSKSINPESVKISINNGKQINIKPVNNVYSLNFNLLSNEKKRIMLLDAMYNRNLYQKYFQIPLPDDDFDVSFYPEGGSALYGCQGKIAFKSMKSDGTDTDVSGIVYDRQGNEITTFMTEVKGMGMFLFTPKQGEKYYAVCTNGKGQSKRFELPDAKEDGYVLTSTWNKDNLLIKVQHPKSISAIDTLLLIIHTRGIVLDAIIIENTNRQFDFPKNLFPSGVSNLLLLTKYLIPVSERLIFVNNEDQAKVTTTSYKEIYNLNSPVDFTVSIKDVSGKPLQGNVSVSVTDDNEVAVDTKSNILTSLLLSSDLRGNISDPAFYFNKNPQSAYALELLMLTQGWRRYNTERIINNDFIYPDALLENEYEISGIVRNHFSEKPEENANVSILSLDGTFSDNTVTDNRGRFYFQIADAPDSMRYIVETTPKSGSKEFELILDAILYPKRIIPAEAFGTQNQDILLKYADKAEKQYRIDNVSRTVNLRDPFITAKNKILKKSIYYNTPDRYLSQQKLERSPSSSMRILLEKIPGVKIVRIDTFRVVRIIILSEKVDIAPLLLLDDFPISYAIFDLLDVDEIAQIDVLTSPKNLAAFGSNGKGGVIAIHTKDGDNKVFDKNPYLKCIMPLGFQKPAEFYSPKHDSPENNAEPDLRTTIYWQPNLNIDKTGTASFQFYTADTPSTYSVVIEGVADDGKIIYKREKLRISRIE